jgi:hypothetical protein
MFYVFYGFGIFSLKLITTVLIVQESYKKFIFYQKSNIIVKQILSSSKYLTAEVLSFYDNINIFNIMK